MRYVTDNDLHIHTYLSPCSGDERQNPEFLLEYAKKNGFSTICITDHYWDPKVPGATAYLAKLDTELLKKALPLPKSEGVRFLFGAETELDRFGNLAIEKETCDEFDFVVVPINHFHMEGFTIADEEFNNVEAVAKRWLERFNYVLDKDLPFGKIGFAHLSCELMITSYRRGHLDVMKAIPEGDTYDVFKRAAEKGAGIELNFETFFDYTGAELEELMEPYRIAKSAGCKFYFGSDGHHPEDMERSKEKFERVVDLLDLTEDDKFVI